MSKPQNKAEKQSPYSVDMFDHKVSANGVEGFYWPVLHSEITEAATELAHSCASCLKAYDDQDIIVQIYKMTMKYYLAQTGGVLQSCLVKKRFLAEGFDPQAPKDWVLYPYIFNDQPPPLPALITKLKTPKIRQGFLNRILNPSRTFKLLKKMSLNPQKLSIDGLKIKPLNAQVMRDDIIATQRTPLIIEHASIVDKDVVFGSTQKWFENIEESDLEVAGHLRKPELEKQLLEKTRKLFKTKGVDFPDFLYSHLQDYLQQLFEALYVHYSRILEKENLPAELWTGTGGNIWDLILRLGVLQKGGRVVGHDHGGGTGHADVPIVGLVELWACSEFVTFNKKQAGLFRGCLREWPLLDNALPEVSGLGGHTKSHVKNIYKDKPTENVLLLSTLYDRDRGRSFAFYPDLVYTDWQARLIGKLHSWGFKTQFKPHPESQIDSHPALEKVLGAKTIDGLFSEILDGVDLIVFDYTYTTVLLEALKTDIPIVLIDFDSIPWHSGAKELVEKRCGFVEGGFNSDNRASVDWNVVQRAIDEATSKRHNREFLEEFYL